MKGVGGGGDVPHDKAAEQEQDTVTLFSAVNTEEETYGTEQITPLHVTHQSETMEITKFRHTCVKQPNRPHLSCCGKRHDNNKCCCLSFLSTCKY